MAELKFTCPHCNQKISCDELWGGHQLQCPSCQREVTVPPAQAAPVAPQARISVHTHGSAVPGPPPPPPSAQPKLSLGRPQHAQASEPGAAAPARATPVYRPINAPVVKKSGPMKWVTIGAVVVALGAGGYFGYEWYAKHQEEADAKARQNEKDLAGSKTNREGATLADVGGASAKPAEKELPIIAPVWTLEVAAAKIPEARANGKISGTNFVVESANLIVVGSAHVLSLRQGGTAASPDREVLVYLHPKAGEALTGQVWTVSKDMKGAGVPQVAKRWKTNPKFAPTLRTFPAGYAMKLELGQITEGEISGKIFLALPDAEQSVVAGMFKATTSLTTGASPTASPGTPVPAPTRAPDPAFEKRYGIKR